jgi:hypothetical protein
MLSVTARTGSQGRRTLRAYQVNLAGDEIGHHQREHSGIAIGCAWNNFELLGAQSASAQSTLDGGDTRSHCCSQTRIEDTGLKNRFQLLRVRCPPAMPPHPRGAS